MARDDSGENDESTKQVDRDALHRALNQSVDSREVLDRVNEELRRTHDLSPEEGTAKVDRDAVRKYLETADPPPGEGEAVDQVDAASVADASVSAEGPVSAEGSVSPTVHVDMPSSPAPANWQQIDEPYLEPQQGGGLKAVLLWLLLVAIVGVLTGVALALAWTSIAG